MNLHPYQQQRVRVTQGQYEGATGKVTRIVDGYGASGFVELAFDKQDGKKLPKVDLIPVGYLAMTCANSEPNARKNKSTRSPATPVDSLF